MPWVIFGSGLLIGVLMLGYTRLVSLLPRRWALPITQAGMAVAMLGFWVLFRTAGEWVSVAFYIWGLILGILLISQFWTLANGIYDPRQAKRLFGFVGGGVMLGGMTGAGLTAPIIEAVGANTLLLWSAFTLLACAAHRVGDPAAREREAAASVSAAVDEEKGVSIGARVRAAARIEADSAHRRGHQLRIARRAAHRPAAEHGRGDCSRARGRRIRSAPSSRRCASMSRSRRS